MRFRLSIILKFTLLVVSFGVLYEVEAKSAEAGHATVSRKGKGVIDDLGDGDRIFSITSVTLLLLTLFVLPHVPQQRLTPQ